MGSITNDSHFINDTDYYEEQSSSLFDIHILVPVTIISIILFFLGVTGNVITIFIFKQRREMRTTVNMYLSSMALSDILICLGLPSDLYRIWKYRPYIFGDFLCKFVFYLSETCTYCTILHITALSVERYFAICFPLKARTTITKCRVRGVILGLWVWSLLTAGPILFLFGVEHRNGSLPDETRECKYIEHLARTGLLETMTWVSTIYFFLPILCLTLLYGLICRKLWSSRHNLRGPQAASREKYHKQTIKMLGKHLTRLSNRQQALCYSNETDSQAMGATFLTGLIHSKPHTFCKCHSDPLCLPDLPQTLHTQGVKAGEKEGGKKGKARKDPHSSKVPTFYLIYPCSPILLHKAPNLNFK